MYKEFNTMLINEVIVKISSFYLILIILFTASCASAGSNYLQPPIGYRYGARTDYGEKIHPGIDYDTEIGRPIIAVSDGEVIGIKALYRKNGQWRFVDKTSQEIVGVKEPSDFDGYFMKIRHGNYFDSFYGHLSTFFVDVGQPVKRGQLIGLSGVGIKKYPHLHFGIIKVGGNAMRYSETYNPDDFWLDGKAQCFDTQKNYSNYSQRQIIGYIRICKQVKME